MGKTNKNTKKFIHKGGLKSAIAKRPVEKKIKEAKVNKLHKAREYDANEKETKLAKDEFRMNLEKLISQKKKLPAGEDQLDISEFLQRGFESDDDSEDISDDDGGDLEFGNEGQQVKGGKKKGKGKKQIVEDDLSEGEEFEDEGEDSEGGDMEDAEMSGGEEAREEGEEMEDDDEGLIEDEGAAYDEADEEEDEGGDDDDDDDEEGVPKKKKKIGRQDRKKMIMERNLKKLMGEDGSLSDLEEEVDAHRQELKGLQESDPSFFDYLAKEGKDVLDFDKLSREMKEKKQIESGGIITVTSNLLHTWIENAIEKDSIEEVKKILTAFQVSVMTEDEAVESQMPFRIGKEAVYHELTVFCLEHMTDLFYDLLGESGKNIKPTKATDTPNQKQQIQLETIPTFSKIKKLVYIYANVVLKLLEDTSDANMLSFVIKHLVQFIPFISTSSSHSKKFLQALLRIWATPSAEAVARMSAFICLRQLALYRPFPFINTVLRGIYLIYMHNCKSMSSNDALNSIAFMRNCVVEMYGIDFECSYQHMFTYLRQLAVTLQKALVSPSQDSLGQVYSWQYLNALHLWTAVLSAYPTQQNLTLLIYPLVQVIQGSLTLDGSPRYYPYRIHLIRMLNTLAQANPNTFINSLPFTLDLLNGPILQDKLPGNKKVFVDFKVMRKATEDVLHTKQFQDELLNQITELLSTNLSAYAYSISFPEYSTFAIKLISEYIKDHDEGRSSNLGQLLSSVEQNSVFIRRLREKTDKAPKDITNAVKTFFSPTLKNVDKAPVVLFQTKFSKQVEKWEAVWEEKRKKMQVFNNNDSDNEEVDDSDDEEDSKPTKATKQNGAAAEEEDEDEDDDEEDDDEEAETPKKNKKQKKEERPQETKRKKEVQSLSQFGEDVVGEMVVSDDDEEEAPKKKAKIEKSTKSPKKQNGTPTKTKGDKKPKKKN